MPTFQLPPALAAWLAAHHGVVDTATLRSHGVGRKAHQALLDSGVLRSVTRGVFALTTALPTLEHRCRVLCCIHPDGFVTGPTAGSLAGLRRQPVAALHFATLHGRRLDASPGVHYRQSTAVTRADRVERPDGITVASWPRLAFDLASDLRQLDHRSVVNQLLDRNLVTQGELIAVGTRLCHPARPGSTTFRRTIADVFGTRPQDSHAEVVLRDALVARGLPIESQVPVRHRDGRTFHVDLGVPAVRWGIELDIHPEHRSTERHLRDSQRVRSLHVHDWQIEPVSELDMRNPARLADELAVLYRERAAAIGGSSVLPGVRPDLGRG